METLTQLGGKPISFLFGAPDGGFCRKCVPLKSQAIGFLISGFFLKQVS